MNLFIIIIIIINNNLPECSNLSKDICQQY